jgi:hypothetical protein
MDLGEATYRSADFVPGSFRVQDVPGKTPWTQKPHSRELPLWKKTEFRVTGHSKPPVGRKELFFPIEKLSYKSAHFLLNGIFPAAPLSINSEKELFPPDQPVNDEDQDGAQNRSDEPGRLALSIPAELLPDVTRDEGPADTEKNRNDKSARISSRREQLGDGPNHKTDHDQPQNIHTASFK